LFVQLTVQRIKLYKGLLRLHSYSKYLIIELV